jgi:hypothetical protein
MRTRATIAGLGALAAMAIACSSGGADTEGPGAQGNAADATTSAGDAKKSIVLEVTGPAKADITYLLNSDTSQENGRKLPWKKTLTSSEAATIVSLSAQNSGSGTITCKITMNGKVVKTNKSKGQYSIVSCEADNI